MFDLAFGASLAQNVLKRSQFHMWQTRELSIFVGTVTKEREHENQTTR